MAKRKPRIRPAEGARIYRPGSPLSGKPRLKLPPIGPSKPPAQTKPPPASRPKAPPLPPSPGWNAIAAGQLAGIYDPVLGEYARLIQQRQAESAAQAKAKQDAFRAFAEWYAVNGPQQVQQVYSQAAGNQSAFAKGFSDGFTASMRDLAAESNKQIEIAGGGSAGQQIHVGPEGGDVTYALGGFIPSGMLNQQGAAFAAAAALQPPAIMAEGARQAGEITAAASKDIEALRLEETKLRSELAAETQKLADELRSAGEEAKADRLEALQKRADKRTDQTGTIWVVNDKGTAIKDTGRPTLAGLKYGQDVKMDLARLKKDADTAARLWATLDWRMQNDLIRNKQAARRIWQAQKRLGLTAQNQAFNQWYKEQQLAISAAREGRLTAGAGGEDALGTPAQLSKWRANARSTTRKARAAGASLEEIVKVLSEDPDAGPRAIWGPVVARNSGLSENLPENLKKWPAIRIVQLANKYGFGGPLRGDRAINPATLKAAIAFLGEQYRIWQGLRPKADAALSGGGQTGRLASLWVQAGGDPNVANIAAAIAMGESGGRNNANLVSSVEDSRGLWQINTRAHPWTKGMNLSDPLTNAKAAVRVWKQSGKSFNPWSVYKSGKYKQYLSAQQSTNANYSVPVWGNIIGEPYAGTHTIGNWESDNALDISAAYGSPIYAVADGVIGSQFGSLGTGGRFAGLRLHLATAGNEFYYGHLSRFASGIRPGKRVKRGQLIGYSGAANGVNHLHFGMRYGDPRTLYGGVV